MAKKTKNTFRITGRVIDRKTRRGVAGLGVEAWDKDRILDDLVGSAVTNQRGAFAIEFTASYFKELFLDRQPDLFFKVFRGDALIKSTEDSVLWNVRAGETEVEIEVDHAIADAIPENGFSVSGTVRRTDGRPLPNAVMRAHDQGLRSRSRLGETQTDTEGRYRIGYDKENLLNPERGSANLLVELIGAAGDILAKSEVRFNARKQVTVNLTADTDANESEWERLEARLQPALQGATLTDLADADLAFLEKSTRLQAKQLKPKLQAAKTAAQSQLPDWFHYALLRQGLPGELNAMLNTPEPRIREALAAAHKAAIVALPNEKEMASLWQRFDTLQTDHALDKPMAGRRLKVRQVLDVAGLEQESQRILAKALANRDLQRPNVWSVLQAETGLDAPTLERVRFTLRTAELAEDHLGTITAVLRDERIHSLRDLARHYNPQDWQALLERTTARDGNDLPDDLAGETPTARRSAYARRLHARAAAAYPTVAMAYGLSRREALRENRAAQLLPRIVENDERFDLASVRLDAYVTAKREALDLRTDEDLRAATDELKRVQRLYRLKPEMTVVARLLEDEAPLDSAAAILHTGRRTFVERYGDDESIGRETALAIYQAAENVAAKAFGLYAHFSPTINTSPVPAAIAECPVGLQGVPDYATLFGSLDGCECQPCESVYSPAAYLTDLLAFIEKQIERNPSHPSAHLVPANGLEALVSRSFCDRNGKFVSRWPRRPDIAQTMLSCHNAETELPYVDLVLEILENAVAPRPGNEALQTSLSAEQTAAQPEHFNEGAYTQLANAIFPFSLPFDLWHEEAAIYLDKLGTSRAELLEIFFPFAEGDTPHDLTEIRRWEDTTIAAARLGLTSTEWKLIAGQLLTPARFAAEMWGYSVGEGNTWWHPLRIVDTFLERSGLEYKDLLRLLTLKAINPQGQIRLQFEELNDCDPKKITIENLDSQALSYLHRFLRLQRASGFSLQEMDQVLSALSPETQQGRPAINELLLVRLSHLVSVREKFHLSLGELLSWWSLLDTADYNAPNLPPSSSFYETLFLTGRSHEPQYGPFSLNIARTEIKGATSPLNEPLHLAAIAGAARLPVPDVVDLINGTIPDPDAATLTLANVSLIFRHASLARALSLSVTEYLTLKTLIGFDPFTTANGADKTIQPHRFIERVELVKTSGFSIATLDYLLRQTEPYESGKTVAPTDEWVDGVLESVRAALSPLAPFGAPRDTIIEAIETLGAGPGTAATADALRHLIEEALEEIGAAGEVGTDNALESLLHEALDLVAPGAIVDHASLSAKLAEAKGILDGALIQAAATVLSDAMGVSAAAVTPMLMHIKSPVAEETAGETLLRALVPNNQDSDISPTDAELHLLLRRLHKSALVVGTLKIAHQELPMLVGKSQSAGWLDLTTLPVQGAIAEPSFEPWARLVRLFHFRNVLLAEQQEHLFDLFEIADQFQPGITPHANQERQAYAAKLAELSGWSPEDVLALVGKFDIGAISHGGGGILKARFPQHFADERLPQRILAAAKLLRRLGATAFDVESWVAPPLNPAQRSMQVERIKMALKVRLGEGWADAVKKLRDPLRERQRQALVTYLLHEWHLERADDLFDHFLIDVEMSPCMMTSRLIQATASVQLFVQRVLMNLEPGMYLSEEGAEQWDWMKNYRVWEANRKIFLYPENWIEPELRDDKTPFFKDLENELRQADITNETAETALLHYLEKLHEVARLQVCGQYLETGNPSVLHVFARTRDVPHHYYYRRGLLELDVESAEASNSLEGAIDGQWTPWERVDVDIEGDHLIPVVYNRRVYLFWPIFTSEDEAPLTHLTQQIMEIVGSVFRIQTNLTRRIGLDAMNAAVDAFIDIIEGIEGAINWIPLFQVPNGEGGLIEFSLQTIKQDLASIKKSLETALFPPDSTQDQTPTMTGIFSDISTLLQSFESHLIKLLPAKRLEVQLAWSEYKNDSWSAKKTSSGVVTFRDVVSTFFESLPELPGLGSKGVKRLFTFRGWVDSQNRLQIDCNVALPRSVFNEGNRPDMWLSEPTTIGHFRLNSCNGKLEAFDTEEDLGLLDLASQVLSESLDDAQDILGDLQGDRQLQQRGEPITPDDDPDRPSKLRAVLQDGINLPYFSDVGPLPSHFSPSLDLYRVLARHQDLFLVDGEDLSHITKLFGFFYQDAKRVFFCLPWKHAAPVTLTIGGEKDETVNLGSFDSGYIFFPFYHPHTCDLLENLQRAGVHGIYQDRYVLGAGGRLRLPRPEEIGKSLQVLLEDEEFFQDEYQPDNVVRSVNRALRPIEEFNFSTIGAYAQYNWEIFFHIPLLIAARLSTNQKFREAQHWFHYIFNPTDASKGSVPEKYWRTKPFVEQSQSEYSVQDIDQLLLLLNSEAEIPGLQEIEWAVRRWRRDAFNPHLVARTRTVAFQKAVVMKYIDNLIAWGDSLFRRETREAVNEAMQLYILAAKLLGPRPRRIPKSAKRTEQSFNQLAERLDAFSNALVDFENYLAGGGTAMGVGRIRDGAMVIEDKGKLARTTLAPVGNAYHGMVRSPSLRDVARQLGEKGLYFCVPPNEKLLGKWDIVADRLFKIRHCQNIEGQALSLALLSPPIDPAILVRAKAMGVDIDSVLHQIYTPMPHYRFQVVLQKAVELCGEVRSLGATLLSALEKRDGEALAMLRHTQELKLLEAMQALKEKQIEESKQTVEGLKRSQESVSLRQAHYQRLLIEFMNPEEVAHTVLGAVSLQLQGMQFGAKMVAAAASLIPNVKGGFVTTLGATYGGANIGSAAQHAADGLGHLASLLSALGGLISTMGGYRRRAEDWLLQVALATKEHQGLERQIAAAEIRLSIAQSDLENHKLQISNNHDLQTFMQGKFTSEELYDWMASEISSLYFQTYQMAYELARQSEMTMANELGVESPGIVKPGYWDSLKKGLLAGEHLYHDLKRLDVAYMNQNVREYELTKHVSMRQVDPLALLMLRATGRCTVTLPEALFDMDGPGHYFRRIKTVAVSIPCVTGPYAGVNCTLTLLRSGIRRHVLKAGEPYVPQDPDTDRFQSIVTSSAQNDSGLLETNLRDERYLPFENAGVISEWQLELPANPSTDVPRQFDYETISDVILHMRFTARDGGGLLRTAAADYLNGQIAQATAAGSMQLFSLRHDFPTEWARFQTHTPGANQRFELALNLREEHYPFWSRGYLKKVLQVEIIARSTKDLENLEVSDKADTNDSAGNKDTLTNKDKLLGNLLVGKFTNIDLPSSPVGELKFFFEDREIGDLWIAVAWGS